MPRESLFIVHFTVAVASWHSWYLVTHNRKLVTYTRCGISFTHCGLHLIRK